MSRTSSESTPSSSTSLMARQDRDHPSGKPMAASPSSASSLYLKQLGALLWKSLIVRRVHFISTFFELLGPVLLVFIFALLYSKTSEPKDSVGLDANSPEDVYNGPVYYNNPIAQAFSTDRQLDMRVLYAPDNGSSNFLLDSLRRVNANLMGLHDENSLRSQVYNESNANNNNQNYNINNFRPVIGIYFENVNIEKAQIKYKIYYPYQRFQARILTNLFPFKLDQSPASDPSEDLQMVSKAISFVGRDFIAGLAPQSNILKIELNHMPYPRYKTGDNNFINAWDFVGAYIVIAYIVICPLIVKRITDEKSTKSKELLRMVGMSDLVFWSAHFFSYLILFVFHAAAITLILFNYSPPVFSYSSGFLFFIAFVLYGIQIIMFSMLITTVFNRPVVAVIVTVILWLVLMAVVFRGLLPSVNQGINISQTNFARVLTSFLPTSSIIWFTSMMGTFEMHNQGLTWSNLNERSSTYLNFTGLTVLFSMIGSYFIYAFLIWYLDNVWPFQFGVPKSPIFLFKPSYWFPGRAVTPETPKPKLNEEIYEPEPVGLEPSIEVQDVCKVFRSAAQTKYAVDHLWLSIYQNQITVLLGHNGAGKTTTMNMITGIYKSSSGAIYVDGFNVFTQTNQARRSIGLCPQENIIFNELTVYQHLRLFAIIKDHPYEDIEREVDEVIDMLQLRDKRNVLATSLSGGMKRKLALGIALVGGTKILILDEPTSGMDPEARRVIWDLLMSIRRQRTILLTTHYMEEADVLGDRIAIMNDGKLCCSGSPFFLKNAFGTGYQLRVEKQRKFNARSFEQVLQKYIPTVSLKSEIETEVIYSFNQKASDKSALVSAFPALFKDIEANKQQYCINSCGLSYSTLEDVFLQVGSDSRMSSGENGTQEANNELNPQVMQLTMHSELTRGSSLLANQFVALFLKRFHFAKRYWTMFIFQLVIPSLIILAAMKLDTAIRSITSENDIPEINLNLQQLYGSDTVAFYSGSNDLKNEYISLNKDKYGASVNDLSQCVSMKNDEPLRAFSKCLLDQTFNLDVYIQKFVTGLSVFSSSGTYGIWYNSEQTMSLPIAITTGLEAIARLVLPNLRNEVSIDVTIHPVHIPDKGEQDDVITSVVISWVITCLILLPIAFPFLASSYILFPVREQVSKSKLLQLMTGLSPTTFWIANFIFDLLYHLLAISLLTLLIFLLDSNGVFFGNDSKASGAVLFAILFAFGVGAIPLAYVLSYVFKTPSGGFVFLVITSLIFGLIANLVMSVFDILNTNLNLGIFPSWDGLAYLFRLVPIFSMLFGYQKLYKAVSFSKVCKQYQPDELKMMCMKLKPGDTSLSTGCCPDKCLDKCYEQGSPFSFGPFGAGQEFVFLILDGLVLLFLIVLFETYKQPILKLFANITSYIEGLIGRASDAVTKTDLVGRQNSRTTFEDSDVIKERERIELLNECEGGPRKLSRLSSTTSSESATGASTSDLLYAHGLTKRFGGFLAVDHLTFGVHHNECFGLLGVNGAGKTTTFSMLTGDLLPTAGDAYLESRYSLMRDLSQFRSNIGYCPQFDALLDLLTGEETLYLFARLRGVPTNFQKRDVDNLIKMVGLEKHATKPTGAYSGGNRRKLSIAVALIGNPPLIFLDEPSAGVDPGARRKIWATLGAVKSNFNSSIILTSHSMEECEALCSRIAIMVSGRFRCLGSTQHLRTKYGQGYSILIRLHRQHELDQEYSDSVQTNLCQALPSAVLRDSHQCLMNFHVPDKTETWSNIFERMAKLDQQFNFEDYVVSDTTLENIFIMFARSQQNRQQQS